MTLNKFKKIKMKSDSTLKLNLNSESQLKKSCITFNSFKNLIELIFTVKILNLFKLINWKMNSMIIMHDLKLF